MSLGALIGGGISALGSLGSAAIQSNASQQASQQQQLSQQEALMTETKMFEAANSALSPYYTAGQSVLPTLTSLLTPGASQTATLSKLPGLQFQQQYGDLAATNQLAAQGLGGSGGPLGMALSNYNQGLASTSFNNLVSQEQNYANMGSGAASSLAGAAQGFSGQMANSITGAGNAAASGTLGSANAISTGLTGGASSIGNALLLSQLMNNGGSGNNNSSIYGSIT